MSTFFFHLRHGADEILDPDGIECPDLRAVRARALEAARDLIASDVRTGLVDLGYRLDVENAAGLTVHSLDFEDAFTIRHPPAPASARPCLDHPARALANPG